MDARQLIRELRLDEILVILLDHEYRDLVYYICGVLVNLASDPACSLRLAEECKVIAKLTDVLQDCPKDDQELKLCSVKVLTNLTLDERVTWQPSELANVRGALKSITSPGEKGNENHLKETADKETVSTCLSQLVELATHLLARLPLPDFACVVEGCGR